MDQNSGECHTLIMDLESDFASKQDTGNDGTFFFTMKTTKEFFNLNDGFVYIGKVVYINKKYSF